MDLYVSAKNYRATRRALEQSLHLKEVLVLHSQYNNVARNIEVKVFRSVKEPGDDRMFQLVVSPGHTPDLPIPSFHSTLVMNIMNHKDIILAYPRLTLHGRGIVNCTTDRFYTGHAQAIGKYLKRGFHLSYPQVTSSGKPPREGLTWCDIKSICPRDERNFYDPKCLVIPFGLDEAVQDHHGPKEKRRKRWTTKWTFGNFGCGGECKGFRLGKGKEVQA